MGLVNKDVFVCLDCETTGLEFKTDRIIEIAVVLFDFDKIHASYETLIDPETPIPEASTAIHHITDVMVKGQPTIRSILPKIIEMVGSHIIVGHAITTDLKFLAVEAERHQVPCNILQARFIDTLRLARLYGESPTNSLESLRKHFNIQEEGAHRAMSDVTVNIDVFKYLAKKFQRTEQILERLKSPIQLKAMPLGKHKGRSFAEIPIEYLRWAVNQDFDQDLIFSLKTELKKRKQGTNFSHASNPFSHL